MGVLDIVHVTAQVIDHAITHKPQRAVARFLAKVARERQDIDLETGAGIVQLLVALAATGVVGVALGVGQDGPVTLDLHVKQQVVKVHELLLERVLKQDVVSRHGDQVIGCILLVKILIHAVLGTQVQLHVNTCIGNRILELHERVRERLTCVLKRYRRHMRREDNAADAHLGFSLKHLQRLLNRL